MNYTPDHIRSLGITAFPNGDVAAVIADAIDIADSCARADIECNVPRHSDGDHGAHWYDTAKMLREDENWLNQSLRYLEARGQLLRDPVNPAIVSFPD